MPRHVSLTSRSIILLICLFMVPDTSYTVLILIYPKVAFLCIGITLLARVRIATEHVAVVAQGKADSGLTTGESGLSGASSQGAVYYKEDKGGLVHSPQVVSVGSTAQTRTAMTAWSAALTESTIEPEPRDRGTFGEARA